MIVVGVDVHKHSLTAVAVGDAGRLLSETTVLVWVPSLALVVKSYVEVTVPVAAE